MNGRGGARGTLLLAAAALSGMTCQRSVGQCRTDNDCASMGNHPYCVDSLCVVSGLQPKMCFFVNPPEAVPITESDFLNACSPNALLPGANDPVDGCLTFSTPFDSGAMLRMPPSPPPPSTASSAMPTSLCSDLLPPGKQIVYITGSSNFAPLLQGLSQVVVNKINIVPVFRTTTSCTGVRSMNPLSPSYVSDHYIKDPTTETDTYAQIFLGDGMPAVSCLLGPSGVAVDIGESEIAQETCGEPANPPDLVQESLGPILPIIFAVPRDSRQRVISAAAAQQVFGGGGGVPPWENPQFLYIRGQGTATLRLVAKEIGLLPSQFWGTDQGSASAMAQNLSLLLSKEEADPALGMLGTDYYDQPVYRDALRALGFQANGQSCAYLPDSSLTSRDKINVRDGHYPLWGRIHFFNARMNGMPISPVAATFLYLFVSPMLDPDILAALINAGWVPPCAMKVTRDTDLGDFTYADPPPVACGCAFEAQVGVDPLRPACVTCTSSSDCPQNRSTCNYGYCEAVE